MTEPWLSVVTVVKDDTNGLARTMASLTGHDDDIELIVHDGSTSQDACDRVRELSALAGASYAWAPPRGVYPAMNEAWPRATGQAVLFLNAGDELVSLASLEGARNALASKFRWCFGRVQVISRSGTTTDSPAWEYAAERRHNFARGLFPPHQATFMERSLLADLGGFDEHYRIAADYELALRASLIADPAVIDEVIARFHEGGASTLGWTTALREFHRARRQVLHPHGAAAIREYADTARAWVLAGIYRGLLRR